MFSGCPYGDTTTRVSNPWLVAGNVVPSAARGGDALIAPTGPITLYIYYGANATERHFSTDPCRLCVYT